MPRTARLSPLCSFGHAATHQELLSVYGQESAILPFRMNHGLALRLRHDTFVCAHLSEAERSAAWCGGWVDCVSALAILGLPVDDHGEPHVRMRRGDGHASARRRADLPTARVHWSRLRTPVPSLSAVRRAARKGAALSRIATPPREALRQAMTSCLGYAESAELLKAMLEAEWPADDLAHAIAVAPRRVRIALERIDGIPPAVGDVLRRLAPGNHF